jgi:hypothetical protein
MVPVYLDPNSLDCAGKCIANRGLSIGCRRVDPYAPAVCPRRSASEDSEISEDTMNRGRIPAAICDAGNAVDACHGPLPRTHGCHRSICRAPLLRTHAV